jgi:hypothetical protein
MHWTVHDCVRDGLLVVVPQLFESEQVLDWVLFKQEVQEEQVQFSTQAV